MKDDRSKSNEVISKLTQLTQQGKLNWEPINLPASFTNSRDSSLKFSYTASYKNKKLLIYQERKRNVIRDFTGEVIISYDDPKTNLEIIKDDFYVLWTFPISRSIDDLFYSIRFRYGGIKEFFDDVLDT